MSNPQKIVLSTAYLPPLEWFSLIVNSAEWEIERYERYQKQSYRSRCHILSANGTLPLYIPIERALGLSIPITQVKIDYKTDWQIKHWRAIESAYRRSPFFEYYQDDFRPFYLSQTETLFDYNRELIKLILSLLGLNCAVNLSDRYYDTNEINDFRERIHPKKASIIDSNKNGRYHQVFAQKFGFVANLSIIDLLFNEGPQSLYYLKNEIQG